MVSLLSFVCFQSYLRSAKSLGVTVAFNSLPSLAIPSNLTSNVFFVTASVGSERTGPKI
ncbi:hypothetical protein M9Y10_032426 [Tritrichomonas musculus]|uniref:Uncharacterized protein n=1 Tax=Tritrichomonas musculus TaxID=1915356 RepID=A0ABR2GZ66_9EUKA